MLINKNIFFLFFLVGLFMSCANNSNKLNSSHFLSLETYTLPNGLKVVLAPTASQFTTVALQYNVGGIYEKDSQLGLSHLLEHLMFKTSKNLKTGEFNLIVEKDLGGSFNAMTMYDSTIYYETMSSEYTDQILKLEAERMVNLTLVPEEVEKEKYVVIEEMRNRIENRPLGYMYHRANAIFFNKHVYGRDLGGAENILSIPDKVIQDYYHSYYAPNNATLIIAGKIIDNIKLAIEKYFQPLEASKISPPTIQEDFTPTLGNFSIKKSTDINYVMLWKKIPEANHPLIPAINLISNLLSESNSSPFIKELLHTDGLLSNISTMVNISAMPNAFLILFTPYNIKDIPVITKKINILLQELKASSILDSEVKKISLIQKTNYYNSLQSTTSLALSIAKSLSLKQSPDFYFKLETQPISKTDIINALDYLISSEWTTFEMLKTGK